MIRGNSKKKIGGLHQLYYKNNVYTLEDLKWDKIA